MLGRIFRGQGLAVRLSSTASKKNTAASCSVFVRCYAAASGGGTASKEQLPDTDYNFWKKFSSDKYPRSAHWQHKYADLRWQYLQDPEVKAGVVPIIYKDSPERDLVNWPAPKQAETSGRVRMFIFPEEFFNLLYSKTGVTGPYVIVWGTLAYLWSQEMIRLDNETSLMVELTLGPLFIYHRIIAPRLYTFLTRHHNFNRDSFESFKAYNIGELELQNINEKLDFEMSKSASRYTFEAKKEMFQLQWESTYRARLYEAYEKVRQRLDFYTELEACKARHESRHMVNWIVDSVRKSITPEQESAALAKCLSDLKSLAGRVKL